MADQATKEAIALFLMKGGKINRVAADTPKRMTDRQWYRRLRDDDNERVEQ